MDISVSHLNSRLALQLPTELPLGLVFVMGEVTNLSNREGQEGQNIAQYPVGFDLIEGEHSIHCLLSARASSETPVANGDHVRAGGHLLFDVQRASYYLLTRDVEGMGKEPEPAEKPVGRSALTPILADIKKRSEVATQKQTDLPVWVQRLAPPEIQTEMPGLPQERETVEELAQEGLNDDLVNFLSEAMESSEDVELTIDLLQEVAPDINVSQSPELAEIYEVPSAAPVQTPPVPQSRKRTLDWSIVLIIVSVLILAVALILILLTRIG
ncbi:MAG: exodeoxyribonuclease VII large subunit [Ardenticatenaceae bacterium]|nr:exodeoxyribonuclease VII large subunit [Anaerolineales bacterium]MCB8922872.1 exodeoxyribonuclease VII large subunit [Ardenticatenaceae bacterium]